MDTSKRDLADVRPPDGVPGNIQMIIQAAIFYLEAATIAVGLAVLVCCLSFAVMAQLMKLVGWEQDGSLVADIVLFVTVGALTLVTLVYAFLTFFQLLAQPVAGRIVCAIGSLIWALPVGISMPALLKHVIPGFKVFGTWIVYLAVAGLVYWLKRRVVRG